MNAAAELGLPVIADEVYAGMSFSRHVLFFLTFFPSAASAHPWVVVDKALVAEIWWPGHLCRAQKHRHECPSFQCALCRSDGLHQVRLKGSHQHPEGSYNVNMLTSCSERSLVNGCEWQM